MVWLTRRDPASAPRDGALPFVSVAEAEEIRTLVRRAFGEHRLEVTMFADHLVDSEEREFALWNVAMQCHTESRRHWPRVVSEHVTAVLEAFNAPDPFEYLSGETAEASVFGRLQEVSSFGSLEHFHHRRFAEGVVEMLAVDLPLAVQSIPREQVERFGGWTHLREVGLRNLRNLPMGQVLNVPAERTTVRLMTDDSMHTGSRALVAPDLMREVGDNPGEAGWLLSVPNRHQVAWHVITGPEATDALATLSVVAERCYDAAPGTISRDVHWWNGESYEALTSHASGQREITIPSAFAAMLRRLS